MKKTLLVLLLAVMMIAPGFARATTPVPPPTAERLQEQINILLLQIKLLQAQQAQLAQYEKPFCHNWTKNLRIEDEGYDVAQLQTALTREGFSIASNELSPVAHFEESTASAVVGFQEKYQQEILVPSGLKRGNGYVGRLTRAKLNKLYDCKNTVVYPTGSPVISGVGGPTTLALGQTGTWEVTAKDPQGGSLKYSVTWGDEYRGDIVMNSAAPSMNYEVAQSSSFTHVYNQEGKYSPTFTVTDESGRSAKTSISVVVGYGSVPNTGIKWLPAGQNGIYYNEVLSTARLSVKSGSLPAGLSLIYGASPCPMELPITSQTMIPSCAYEPVTRLQGIVNGYGKSSFVLTDNSNLYEYGFYVIGNATPEEPVVSELLPNAQVGKYYKAFVKVGATYGPLTVAGGVLPYGLILKNTSNVCNGYIPGAVYTPPADCANVPSEPTISGWPTQGGKFGFTLSNATMKQDFTIIVYDADYVPAVSAIELPSATTGVYYSHRTKLGNTANYVAVVSGTLPAGISVQRAPDVCPMQTGIGTPYECTYSGYIEFAGTPTSSSYGQYQFKITDSVTTQAYSFLVSN